MNIAPDSLKSPRFCGIRSFMRQPLSNDYANADATILGIPFDTGVSYRPGARFGPAAIREASTILKPYCPVLDVDVLAWLKIIDSGDIDTIPGYMEDSYELITNRLKPVFTSGTIPVLMGGDHSISLPILRALAKVRGPVALVHFDAHSDTIPEYYGKPYNHGSPFYHAIRENLILPEMSTQIGIRGPLYSKEALDWPREKGLEIITGQRLHDIGMAKAAEIALARAKNALLYVSFDIDFLDASCAPGTGTPEVEGFSSFEALSLMRKICPLSNLAGMDLVEVLPARSAP